MHRPAIRAHRDCLHDGSNPAKLHWSAKRHDETSSHEGGYCYAARSRRRRCVFAMIRARLWDSEQTLVHVHVPDEDMKLYWLFSNAYWFLSFFVLQRAGRGRLEVWRSGVLPLRWKMHTVCTNATF